MTLRKLMAVMMIGLLIAPAVSAAEAKKSPKATVELLADVKAVKPGATVRLGLRFDIIKEWHIYWRNPGSSGKAPSVHWELPDGFELGPLQFPAPKREVTPVGDNFILERRPMLLAELTVPDDAPVGKTVTIRGNVDWLVCRELCVLEKQEVSLALPVVAADAELEPTNESLFGMAVNQLPVPADQAKYLTLKTAASVDRVRPKDEFKIALVLDIKPDHHIQAHKPLSEGFIATDVFPDDVKGLTIGDPIFPKPSVRALPGIGDVAEYHGRIVIRLPVRANADLKGNSITLSGVLTYQACEDKRGECFAPQSIEWKTTVPVAKADAAVQATHADLFGAAGSGAATAITGGGQTFLTKPEAAGVRGGFTIEGPIHAQRQEPQHSIWVWLLLAAVAGLVLNVTPCVLPVISIKVLSFVQQAQESPARVLRLGLAFALGMMLVFNILAVLATGAGLVWGQHFQSTTFNVVMAAIIFAFGLSLFGVFELGVPRSLEDAASKEPGEGYVGSIAKGALATALGTPCLGPVLGSVLTWAVAQPPAVVFLVFNMIGVGMAAPYVVLTANPKWLRFVPKPGAWMETFKHVMGFVLMATVIYLLDIVVGQVGAFGLVLTLAFLLAVGFACWLWGRYVSLDRSGRVRGGVMVAAAAVVVLGWMATIPTALTERPAMNGAANASVPTQNPTTNNEAMAAEPASVNGETLDWQPFSLQRLQELTAAGYTVMLDITADWCLNCKYNLRFVLDTANVSKKVRELKVIPMVADWTERDEAIGRLIKALAPGGSIPLLAIFPADRPNEPYVLLGIVTQDDVISKLEAAGPSHISRPAEPTTTDAASVANPDSPI